MAILIGIAVYIGAVVCLIAIVGASRRKQERILRERAAASHTWQPEQVDAPPLTESFATGQGDR